MSPEQEAALDAVARGRSRPRGRRWTLRHPRAGPVAAGGALGDRSGRRRPDTDLRRQHRPRGERRACGHHPQMPGTESVRDAIAMRRRWPTTSGCTSTTCRSAGWPIAARSSAGASGGARLGSPVWTGDAALDAVRHGRDGWPGGIRATPTASTRSKRISRTAGVSRLERDYRRGRPCSGPGSRACRGGPRRRAPEAIPCPGSSTWPSGVRRPPSSTAWPTSFASVTALAPRTGGGPDDGPPLPRALGRPGIVSSGSGVGRLDDETERRIKTDLLELAIVWADLNVRLAPRADADAARQDSIRILDQAAGLLGPSPSLDRERQVHARCAAGAVEPTPITAPSTRWEHYDLGRSYLRSGQIGAAAEEFRRTLDQRPQDFWPNFYQGLCAYRLGQLRGRRAAFRTCIALAPEAAECYYNRALAHEALGRDEQAFSDYGRALELDPRLTAAALNRGLLCYKAGRHRDAIADFLRALRTARAAGRCRSDPLQPGPGLSGGRRPIVGSGQRREGPEPGMRRSPRSLRSPPPWLPRIYRTRAGVYGSAQVSRPRRLVTTEGLQV